MLEISSACLQNYGQTLSKPWLYLNGKLEQISAYKQAEKHYQHKTLPPGG